MFGLCAAISTAILPFPAIAISKSHTRTHDGSILSWAWNRCKMFNRLTLSSVNMLFHCMKANSSEYIKVNSRDKVIRKIKYANYGNLAWNTHVFVYTCTGNDALAQVIANALSFKLQEYIPRQNNTCMRI